MKLKIFLVALAILGFSQPAFAQNKSTKKITRHRKKIVRKYIPRKTIVRQNSIRLASAQPVLNQAVPFYVQNIGGSWSDPILADACEEAAGLMALSWVSGQNFPPAQAHDQIYRMADYEKEHFGFYQDTSAADTAKMLKDIYGLPAMVQYDIGVNTLREVLARGDIAIIPIDGQRLGNPHYNSPAPERHMVIVTGYDPNTDEFIINDPGTRYGRGMRFSSARIQNALQDYKTGDHLKVDIIRTAMIEVMRVGEIRAAVIQ